MEKKTPRRSRLTPKLRTKFLASGLPDVLPVKCGELHARLHLGKMGSGTRGPSIEWDGMWLTPSQFEEISGLGGVRNWKRSILYENRSLNSFIKLGLIQLHKRYCDCVRCITPLMEMSESHPAKRARYGRTHDDRTPDGVGGNNEFDDDILILSTDMSPPRPKRRQLRRTSVRFVDVNESGYVTLTGSAPTTEFLTDRTEAGLECPSTYVSRSDFPNRTSNDEEHRWQTANDSGDPLVNDEQPLARYLNNENDYGLYEGNALAAVEVVKRQSPPRASSGTGEVCPRAGPRKESDRSPPTGSQQTVKCRQTPKRKRQANETLTLSSDVVFNSPDYRSYRGSRHSKSPSVPTGTTRYSSSKTLKVQQRKKKPLPQSEHPSKNYIHVFGGTDVDDAREGTVHERLTKVINKAGLAGHNASSWSVDQVALFVDAAGFPFQSSLFRKHLINGDALMAMRERHLMEHLKMKLGPSLRLFALVRGLQSKLA